MKVVENIKELKNIIKDAKKSGKTVGFVPTMGYLHEGHLSLVRQATTKCDFVVVSIFVNPIQFGPNEDFARYPKDLARDCELVEKVGADVVFAPQLVEMYPEGFNTHVEVNGVTDRLCGKSRPGHFKGVTTVVNKLFNIVEPDIAFFGQKDAQQVVVIRKMVKDLSMNLEIEMVPIIREDDGLAKSSRNKYLNDEERKAAVILHRSLEFAKENVGAGEKNSQKLKKSMKEFIQQEPLAKIDYVEILSYPELETLDNLTGTVIIALAVYIGGTRLIDNYILEV